jgi:hypothetical protein
MDNRTDSETPHQEDMPWNDEPADSATVFGTEEPDPAEVVGDEGREVDISSRGMRNPDQYRRDTLDERLSEEVPDRPTRSQSPETGGLLASQGTEDDLFAERAEADQVEPADLQTESAEEAAVHVDDSGRA